jgi:hypothetical protein
MPAHSASEDARERAYVAGILVTVSYVMPGLVPGIHVFPASIKTWMAPELGLARVP